jgi:hypothetical protein
MLARLSPYDIFIVQIVTEEGVVSRDRALTALSKGGLLGWLLTTHGCMLCPKQGQNLWFFVGGDEAKVTFDAWAAFLKVRQGRVKGLAGDVLSLTHTPTHRARPSSCSTYRTTRR